MSAGKCEASTILPATSFITGKNVGVALGARVLRVALLNGVNGISNLTSLFFCQTDWGHRCNDALSSDRSIFRTGDPSSFNTHASIRVSHDRDGKHSFYRKRRSASSEPSPIPAPSASHFPLFITASLLLRNVGKTAYASLQRVTAGLR